MRTQTTSNETVEMYLKTIAELSDDDEPVIIARVAERLGVSPVTANEMMKRLVDQGLIVHERYKGVNLTENGRFYANSVIRRQRLWECFLVDRLNFNWSGSHEAACRLEHATSNVLAEALSAYLDHPTVCPHGNPIPRADGTMPEIEGSPLTKLAVGERATVLSVIHINTEIFAYLSQHNIVPGRVIEVTEKAPMDGPISIRAKDNIVALGLPMAATIMVKAHGQGVVQATTTLDLLSPGKAATVTRIGGGGAIRRRLMDMGITRGVEIKAVKTSPLGDPVEYHLRGYNLSLRKSEAQMIEITM
jgi:DtxR family transcriptional regulator, Mn-dependent transcriptional regulator